MNQAATAPTRGGELKVAIGGLPQSFNRLVADDDASELVARLTQAPLVRINRTTLELEPWLAERWEADADGRTYTLHLRPDLAWSDGAPLTADDVVFTFEVAFDARAGSVVAEHLEVAGQAIRVEKTAAQTIRLTYPATSGPGLRLLDAVPILPRHKLAQPYAAGTLREAWSPGVAAADVVGAGPFVFARTAGDGGTLVLERNTHYWRQASDGTALPYLDRVVLERVSDPETALARLTGGTVDLLSGELRAEDYIPARRAEEAGVLRVVNLGVGIDGDAFWFRLKPGDARSAFVQKPEFRRALSHAVDREEFAQEAFFGEAVPIWGPITPGNRLWFTPNLPRYVPDVVKAADLLLSIDLMDRDGNGVVEDTAGTEARFTVLTPRGIPAYDRATTVLREQLAFVGVALEIEPVDDAALAARIREQDYEAAYVRLPAQGLDPAGNLDFWLSSGAAHVWNPGQRVPATEWEQRIDTLMREQAASVDPERRRQLFEEVQRIFAEQLPVLYFLAPRVYLAHTTRVVGMEPSVLPPQALWNADSLGVNGPPPRVSE